MAVTLHNATLTAGGASASVKVLLHTATAGSVLLVWSHLNEAVSLSAVAAAGVPLTRIGAVSASTSRQELWGLTAPPSGILTISAILAGTQQGRWGIVAQTFVGQRQIGGSPFGTFVGGTATSDNVAFSVSATDTDLVAFGFGISGNAAVTLGNGTQDGVATVSTVGRLVVGHITGAANTTASATAASSVVWGFGAVPIVASTSATTSLAFDNAAATGTSTVVNSIGLLLTATSDAVLLVFTQAAGGNQSMSAVYAGGTPLTFLGAANWKTDTRRTEIWGLTAPPSGILTISAVVAGIAATSLALGGITYTGHRTTATPFGGVVSGSGAAAASTTLTGSSTAGNILVYGMIPDDNAQSPYSAGPGMTTRAQAIQFPVMWILDVAGREAVTAMAGANAATTWGMVGINLIESGTAAGNRSAQIAVTDIRDTVSIPGYVLIRGQVVVTDRKDTVAIPARARASGAVTVTDIRDSVAISARTRITGLVDSRPPNTDTVAAPGYVLIQAAVNVTDRPDTIAISGYVVGGTITGQVAVTDKPDTVAAPGYALVQAAVNVTDRPDTIAISGAVRATAVVNVTDRLDTVVIPGTSYDANSNLALTVSVTDRPDTVSILINNVSPSAEVVTTLIDPGAGGGGKKRKKPYVRLSDDFWTIREQHLRSLQPEMEESAEPVETPTIATPLAVKSSQLQSYRIERTSVIQKLQKAPDPPKLYNHTRRLKQLNAQIAEQKRLQLIAEQAAAEKEERRRRRVARALKRKVAILAVARLLGILNYLYSKL